MTYILASNIPEIVPYLAFVLFQVPLALTVIQILAIDLGTDMLPALALAAERPEPGVMERPPRHRTERLLSWPSLARAYLFLGPMQAIAAMTAFFLVLGAAGWSYGEPLARLDPVYLLATTACLGAIAVMQIANVFNCRSPSCRLWRSARLATASSSRPSWPRSRSSCSSSTPLLATRSLGPRRCPRNCGFCRCPSRLGCWPWKKAGSGWCAALGPSPQCGERLCDGRDAMQDPPKHGSSRAHQGRAADQDRDRKAKAAHLSGATGRHCVRSVATALPGATVRQTIDGVLGRRFDCLEQVHVLDTGGRLIGLVPLIRLLAAREDSRLEEIMQAHPPTASRNLSQDKLVMLARRERIAAPPVVDPEGRLLGCVPPHAVIEIAGRMHAEDISRLAGILHQEEPAHQALEAPPWRRVLNRLP
jgi:CBS domain-containing protein